MRSIAAGDADGTSLLKGTDAHCGKRKLMLEASLSPSGHVCRVGVPITVQILYSSSASDDPADTTLLRNCLAKHGLSNGSSGSSVLDPFELATNRRHLTEVA